MTAFPDIAEVRRPLPRGITDAERKSQYLTRLQTLRRKVARLEGLTVSELQSLFSQLGSEVGGIVRREYELERAARSVAATASEIKKLQGLSDAKVKELWGAFEKNFRQRLEEVGALGSEAIDEMLETLGEDVLAKAGLTKTHLQESLLLQDFSADLIQEVGEDIIRKTNTLIRLGVTGGKTASEMITDIERFIPTTGTRFAQMQLGELLRAEAIVRTEVGRIYSLAEQLRGEEYKKAGVEIRKQWNHQPSGHPRPGHAELHGETVKMDENFINPVTNNELEFPRDPAAPASEVVNCGCYLTIVTDKFKGLFA